MHLPVLNILVKQLLSKFKAVCSLTKSTQQLSAGIYVTSYSICAAKLKYFSHFFFFCVFVYNIKAWIQQIAFSLLL